MNEHLPGHSEAESKEQKKREYIALARELREHHEGFPFPGMNKESYAKIKADEEEYPGYSTPVDDLIARFQAEGMKVVLGNHPDSGNVFILPLNSDDIEQDNLFPRHIMTVEGMNPGLKKLIEMNSQK